MSDIIDLSSNEEVISIDSEYAYDLDNDVDENNEDLKACKVCGTSNPSFAGECAVCTTVLQGNPDKASQSHRQSGHASCSRAKESCLTLDSCGCKLDRLEFGQHVEKLCSILPADVVGLQQHFCCPVKGCGKELARRDLVNNMDAAAQDNVDSHLFISFLKSSKAQSHETESAQPSAKKYKGTALSREARLAMGLAASIHGMQAAFGPPENSAPGKAKAQPANQNKRKQQPSSKFGIAKGTGYAGKSPGKDSNSGYKHAQKAQAAGQLAIKAALDEVIERLTQASGCLASGAVCVSSMLVCSVVLGSPLVMLIHNLLQNDSLMEMGRHASLYTSVMKLLHLIAKCVDLLPVFLKPATASSRGEAADDKDQGPTILDALQTLNVQCQVFKRNAEDLDCSEAEIRVLSLVLDLNTTYEVVQKAASTLRLGETPHAQLASSTSHHGVCKVETSPKDDQAALALRYCKEMSQFKLRQWPILAYRDHAFHAQAGSKTTSSSGKRSILRIGQELSSMSSCLPVAWASSIFIVTDENRMDVIRAMIVGPEGTPYENGIYVFDILLPQNYPDSPPLVKFLTTGGGRVRSIMGSCQLNALTDPYFNEPGYEATANSNNGQAHSRAYNKEIKLQNLTYGLLAAITKPPPAFKDVLKVHFTYKRAAILAQMADWAKEDAKLLELTQQISEALEVYNS